MQRVVLDTNVIFSALYSRNSNPPSILVDMALKSKFSLYISIATLEEYDEVFHRPKYEKLISKCEADDLIRIIKTTSKHLNPPISTTPQFIDEADRKFYDLAKAANAYLVTGNKKHFPKEDNIITPTDFLKIYI
jgi:putative PIN family toxin of toxin-antitoxin system